MLVYNITTAWAMYGEALLKTKQQQQKQVFPCLMNKEAEAHTTLSLPLVRGARF